MKQSRNDDTLLQAARRSSEASYRRVGKAGLPVSIENVVYMFMGILENSGSAKLYVFRSRISYREGKKSMKRG